MNEKFLIAVATVAIHLIIISFLVRLDENNEFVSDQFNENGVLTEELSEENVSGDASVQVYIVKAGDSLSQIAKRVYGNSLHYKEIYEANKNLLETPESIKAGQKLVIPAVW